MGSFLHYLQWRRGEISAGVCWLFSPTMLLLSCSPALLPALLWLLPTPALMLPTPALWLLTPLCCCYNSFYLNSQNLFSALVEHRGARPTLNPRFVLLAMVQNPLSSTLARDEHVCTKSPMRLPLVHEITFMATMSFATFSSFQNFAAIVRLTFMFWDGVESAVV